jgi:hypothetical protein
LKKKVDISTEQMDQDSDCKPTPGKIKVCSGDHGDTKWKGTTEAEVDGSNNVVSSTIRLNNFYLLSAMRDGARQYTLCHEMLGKFLMLGFCNYLAAVNCSFSNMNTVVFVYY